MERRTTWAVVLSISLALAACVGGQPAEDASGFRVVATTSILGDIVRNVVGNREAVEVLIEAGVDPHSFEPSAADADRLRRADLVVANGLQLEARLVDALQAAESDGVPILRVAEHVDPIAFLGAHAHEDEEDHEGARGHGEESPREHGEPEEHGELDPHFWFDPVRTADGVTLIGDRLAEIAPEAADTITANAAAYRDEILQLHEQVEEVLGAVPEANRKLVTNHDSLGYLAARYGFELVGTVVPGGTTLAAASGRDLAELAETIREAGVGTIFVETTAPDRLARAVGQELERQVEVVELYTGSLGEEGSGAEDYLGMMETNALRIADGLTT